MKKLILNILAATALVACKPEVYTGPLDSPVGSWDGVKAEYFFNGEKVAENDVCEYSAISFYKDSLCCVEGVKGALPYSYDNSTGMLTIDKTVWAVQTLTGADMVIEYLETIFSEEDEPAVIDKTLPIEYNGVSINADENGYYYESDNERIYCSYFETSDETGVATIDFWYDSQINYFIPLVVEVKK